MVLTRIFLVIVGAGLALLGLSATATILSIPLIPKPSIEPQISVLVFTGLCFAGAFSLLVLAWRDKRLRLEEKISVEDLQLQTRRMDSEAKKASKTLDLMSEAPIGALWKVAGAALLVLSLLAASVLLVILVRRPPYAIGERMTQTTNLIFRPRTIFVWWLFVPSLLLGQVAFLFSQAEVLRRMKLRKKQFIENGDSDSKGWKATSRSGSRFVVHHCVEAKLDGPRRMYRIRDKFRYILVSRG